MEKHRVPARCLGDREGTIGNGRPPSFVREDSAFTSSRETAHLAPGGAVRLGIGWPWEGWQGLGLHESLDHSRPRCALHGALCSCRIFCVCLKVESLGEDYFRLMCCSMEISRNTEQVSQCLPLKMKPVHLLLLVLWLLTERRQTSELSGPVDLQATCIHSVHKSHQDSGLRVTHTRLKAA